MRFLSGRNIVLSHTFLDDETVVSGLPSVAVTVFDESNTQVFTGPATSTSNVWSVSVPAKPLGSYTVTWVATGYTDTTTFDVVATRIVELTEIRSFDAELTVAKFPTARIKTYREQVETEFEKIAGRSFVSRSRVVKATGDGTPSVWLGLFDVTALTSVTVDGVSQTLSSWSVDDTGLLTSDDDIAVGAKIVAKVTYGFTSTPEDIRQVALQRIRYLCASETTGIPDRATSYIADSGGQFNLATAGMRGFETGIPEVDAVVKRYRNEVFYSAVTV